jgi:hypothetical protein
MGIGLDRAYRSFGRVWQASTRLDTPPFSDSHHPDLVIAPDIAGQTTAGSGLPSQAGGRASKPSIQALLRAFSSYDRLKLTEAHRDEFPNADMLSCILVKDREPLGISWTHRQNQAPAWLELFE